MAKYNLNITAKSIPSTLHSFTAVQDRASYDLQCPKTTLHRKDKGYNNVASDVSALMVEKYGLETDRSQPSRIGDGKKRSHRARSLYSRPGADVREN